ncbi:MAG: Csu type fimbrial protein [Gammaproteobacteria bacterium]
MKRSKNRATCLLAALLFLFGLLAAPAASAQRCRVRAVPTNFGLYFPASPTSVDVTSRIRVVCRGRPGTYSVELSTGSSGEYGRRTMVNGAELLFYNLFVDPARTRVWGDGSGSTSRITITRRRRGRDRRVFDVYGRIFSNQDVRPGFYNDTISVTVFF